jgi:diketogulonate reductase-like aldo/keto reductase
MTLTNIRGTVPLHNGVRMPYFGLGVFQIRDGEAVQKAMLHALSEGYRLFDTAAAYGNERGVGEALRESGLPRGEVFITTKVWNSDQGFDKTLRAFDASMEKLGIEQLDLYLIHWPVKGKFVDTWKALERLYSEGRTRAIGVSNFLQHHLEELMARSPQIPMINQLEFHPYLLQQPLLDFCRTYNIRHEAWSPLMKGRVAGIAELQTIGRKYGKEPAQVALRWCLQKGVVVIPKSSHADRISSNALVFDFQLSSDDIEAIDGLDRHTRLGPDPDNFNF